MEKEFYFIKKVIDMKEIGKMKKKKVKGYTIIKMVIEKWGIIIMIKKLEHILNYVKMEKLYKIIINIKII